MAKNIWRRIKLTYVIHCLKFWVGLVRILLKCGMSMETINKVTFELSIFMHGCYWYLVPSLFIAGALI